MTFGVVNVVGSTISRLTDCGMFIRAGAEIGVASTKALIGQMTVMVLLAIYFAQKNGKNNQIPALLKELSVLPERLASHLQGLEQQLGGVVGYLATRTNCFFLGKHYQLAVAYEGSLKLKEISYIHSEAYSMAELKHGPLSLLDEQFPVIALCPNDHLFDKNLGNIYETKARNAPVITIGDRGITQSDYHISIPSTIDPLYPFYTIATTQLLAYLVALKLGKEIDKPRNLAKSVTVK